MIKDIINPFRLKKDNEAIKDKVTDTRNLFEHKKKIIINQ